MSTTSLARTSRRGLVAAAVSAAMLGALATPAGAAESSVRQPSNTAPAASTSSVPPAPTPEVSPSVSPTATPSATPSATPTTQPSIAPTPSPFPEVTDREPTEEAADGIDSDAVGPITTRMADIQARSLAPKRRISFTDVSSSAKFSKEIMWLASTGVTTGWQMSNGSRQYRPLDTVERNAMAAFLYRYAGEPAHYAPSRSPFTDIRSSSAFYREITWAAESGISTGWRQKNGAVFRAQDSISREAMAAFLYRFAGSPSISTPRKSPFRDVSTSSSFYKAIVWLASTGATTGWRTSKGAEFRPRASITRDAMAAFLYRLDRKGVGFIPSGGTTPLLRHSTLYVYGASSLTFRTGPTTSASVIGYLRSGRAVTPTGKVSSSGWIEIISDGRRGWVSGYYLKGYNGATITRIKSEYSNGRLPASRLCRLSWDRSEYLLCQAAADLERLNKAFKTRFGRNIPINDSYRDYDAQVRARALYGTMAAVPGTSNHGWAAAIDISGSSLPGGYKGSAYLWLRQQLTSYNWVLPTWARPSGSKPEAWHFEYTG